MTVHVVGGGLAGLVAAITAAEAGAPVVLYEAAPRLGGRAATAAGPYRVNLGPHVLFTDGAVYRWCRARGVLPRLERPPLLGNVLIDDGGVRRTPPAGLLVGAARHLGERAPVDATFTEWATARMGARTGAEMARFAGLLCFHHDPGSLSARFVWDHLRRRATRADRVRHVSGGWSTLIDALAVRAGELGVRVELDARLDPASLPEGGPVVVAANLGAAARLLGRPLTWPGARTALLDVATAAASLRPATSGGRTPPALVADIRSDIRTCCLVNRVTATDPILAPSATELVQAQLGIPPEGDRSAAFARIEQTLDAALPGWRGGEVWRRELVVDGATGALDPPGTTWQDRPAVDQGDGRFLAGDRVAAPGLLAEVSVASAVRAAHLAVDERRQQAFAPGWPAIRLAPSVRIQALAEALPTRATHTLSVPGRVDDVWALSPAEECEPYTMLRQGRLVTVAVAASPVSARVTDVSAVVGTRRSLPRLLHPVLSWWARREAHRRVGPGMAPEPVRDASPPPGV